MWTKNNNFNYDNVDEISDIECSLNIRICFQIIAIFAKYSGDCWNIIEHFFYYTFHDRWFKRSFAHFRHIQLLFCNFGRCAS